MAGNPTMDRVLAIIDQDRQQLVDLALELGRTPSPHGRELEAGQVVVNWLQPRGIESYLQHITQTCVNAVGKIPGVADGTSLIMDAHLDTGAPEPPDAPEIKRKIHGAWVENDVIYGYGIINCKGQVAAFCEAANAIKKAGVSLKGDLYVAGVACETSGWSMNATTHGMNDPGQAFGTKWLFNNGVTADYALIGETSEFTIVTAECGDLQLGVRMSGRNIYTPRLERGASLGENPNAVEKMADVMVALRGWCIEYEKREMVEFPGGVIIPKGQLRGVRGTGRNTELTMDIVLVPGANPRTIARGIRDLTRQMGLECEVTVQKWTRGYYAQHADPLIDAVRDSHRYLFGKDPQPPLPPDISMQRDLNAFNEVGIPSICYGGARQFEPYSDDQNRAMKVDDLVAQTKVYALTAMSICGIA